jgi:hypothetical protein
MDAETELGQWSSLNDKKKKFKAKEKKIKIKKDFLLIGPSPNFFWPSPQIQSSFRHVRKE